MQNEVSNEVNLMSENLTSENLRYKQIKYKPFNGSGKIGFAVVTLQLMNDSKTNEERTSVANALHAKYRTNKAKVIKIENENGNEIKSGCSVHNEKFNYVVGEIVESEFNDDINDVCTQGIHYFMTKEQAQWYLARPQNGEHKLYHNNGQLLSQRFYHNGKLHGEYKMYHPYNKQLVKHCFYHNGKLNGEYKTYYHYHFPTGYEQVFKHYSYKDGLLDGECKEYHDDGHLSEHSFYKDGKLDGEYKSYIYGVIKVLCVYKNGLLDGEYKEYHDDGVIRKLCFYKDGLLNGECKEYRGAGTIKKLCVYKDGLLVSNKVKLQN